MAQLTVKIAKFQIFRKQNLRKLKNLKMNILSIGTKTISISLSWGCWEHFAFSEIFIEMSKNLPLKLAKIRVKIAKFRIFQIQNRAC